MALLASGPGGEPEAATVEKKAAKSKNVIFRGLPLSRQTTAKVRIRDDDTVMLSGLPVIEVREQQGLANPLDQRAAKPLIKKQLLILITTTLVDQAGNRLH